MERTGIGLTCNQRSGSRRKMLCRIGHSENFKRPHYRSFNRSFWIAVSSSPLSPLREKRRGDKPALPLGRIRSQEYGHAVKGEERRSWKRTPTFVQQECDQDGEQQARAEYNTRRANAPLYASAFLWGPRLTLSCPPAASHSQSSIVSNLGNGRPWPLSSCVLQRESQEPGEQLHISLSLPAPACKAV